MTTNDKERREAVRTTDRILFAFDRIKLERYQKILDGHRRGISIYHETGLADIQMYVGAQRALSRLREKNMELAAYLQHLDTKVNIVLQKVSGEKSPFEMMALKEVNFSAAGLAFNHDQIIEKNEILGLHITLLPHYTYIYSFGQVVNCQEEENEKGEESYRVGVEFVLINDDDKEKLVQHNFRQQSQALRNRRLNES